MVMHARKTQRMSDGYFEKHQAHPYQQNSKYGSSKSYGASGDRYERIRDSPNGTYRSDSPDSQSPRDRGSYPSKGSYLQKIREKERENRDYRREKYSSGKYFPDCARSPKDKRSRESEHRTNHDRSEDKSILHPIKVPPNLSRDRKLIHNNCIEKRDDRERVTRVGDWSEHTSSSGKKYYYNCKTEVSQWEKPREWLDRERDRCRNRDRDRDLDRGYSSSSRSSTRYDKHSNSRSGGSKDSLRDGPAGSHWSNSSRDDGGDHKDSRLSRKHLDENVSAQDMDISPGDSTPTSEISYSAGGHQQQQQQQEQNSHGPVLLATVLPRLISHHQHLPSTPTAQIPESSPLANPQSAPSMVPPPIHVTTSNAPGPPSAQLHISNSAGDSALESKSLLTSKLVGGDNLLQQLIVDTNHSDPSGEGPPTPTHSEVPDCSKEASQNGSGLSNLQGASSLQALRAQGPTISPSLAQHVREDLISHIKGWPADIVEKQAQKNSEEAHIMGSIQCSKVSAELKTARSIVRLTEIQATLQEQRILFLRQQIKMLEEMKSQNSFMSDDS